MEEAEEAIKEMISEGIEPDARIFNSLIVHLIRHNAEEDALRIVRCGLQLPTPFFSFCRQHFPVLMATHSRP